METLEQVQGQEQGQATQQTQAPAQTQQPQNGRNGNQQVLKSPDAVAFALIWNQSENRKDALKRFSDAGYHMEYNAMVARAKAYTNPSRPGGKINLKNLPAAPRGRRINSEEVNKAIEEAAAKAAVKDAAAPQGEQQNQEQGQGQAA